MEPIDGLTVLGFVCLPALRCSTCFHDCLKVCFLFSPYNNTFPSLISPNSITIIALTWNNQHKHKCAMEFSFPLFSSPFLFFLSFPPFSFSLSFPSLPYPPLPSFRFSFPFPFFLSPLPSFSIRKEVWICFSYKYRTKMCPCGFWLHLTIARPTLFCQREAGILLRRACVSWPGQNLSHHLSEV